MKLILYVVCGFAGGLVRACQGAYKDTPYEPFVLNKFLRSLMFGTIGGFFWYFLSEISSIEISPVLLIPLAVFFDSICTEMYKRGYRIEDLSKYKMPTIFHLNGHLIHNRILRGLIVVLVIALLIAIYPVSHLVYKTLGLNNIDHRIFGLIFGGFAGFLVSIGGSMLDVAWEGFDKIKFFRSTYVGFFWGVIFSFFTTNPAILIYATLGMDRMSIEFNKTFIKKLKSGKFKSENPVINNWLEIRERLNAPYILCWLLFIYLLTSSKMF